MKNIIISTDNTCDLSKSVLTQRDIPTINLHYFLNDVEHDGTEEFDGKAFYDGMREGANTKTSLANEYYSTEYFEELLKQGKDIVHICLSSALSGTYATMAGVAEQLNKTSKNKIYVVDSISASGGEGLLVTLVDDYANLGKDAIAVRDYAEELKHKVCHYFCVDTIKYLARGGRVSKVAGLIGRAIGIKPVLHCDQEGRLTSLSKEFSRKKSLASLVDGMEAKYNQVSQRVYITSADCDQDAQYVGKLVEEKFGITPEYFSLGPVIGSHSGPGTVALFFTGNDRLK